MKTKEKLEEKLKKLFDIKYKQIEIISFKGRRDAGEYRWYTTNTYPSIVSSETMSDIVKAKNIFYVINDYNELEIILESFENSTFFRHIKINPKITLEIK